jgi:tetratricopeptide (TPR) repeat protein
MWKWIVTILLVMLNLLTAGLAQSPGQGQWAPAPLPLLDGNGASFSPADFQRLLSQLKAEREALDADWKSLTKRLTTRTPANETDLDKLQEQLKQTLLRLQQERLKSPQTAVLAPPALVQQTMPINPEPKKKPVEESHPATSGASSADPGPVDVLHLAQTLYRAERYDEALAAFRSVDLKGKRAEERAPIVYLTAKCLHHLGKTDDAVALLREVANSKGDERLAGYAQWQLENLRWHREIQARLEEIRQRRLATEKR